MPRGGKHHHCRVRKFSGFSTGNDASSQPGEGCVGEWSGPWIFFGGLEMSWGRCERDLGPPVTGWLVKQSSWMDRAHLASILPFFPFFSFPPFSLSPLLSFPLSLLFLPPSMSPSPEHGKSEARTGSRNFCNLYFILDTWAQVCWACLYLPWLFWANVPCGVTLWGHEHAALRAARREHNYGHFPVVVLFLQRTCPASSWAEHIHARA